jgi:hypothetical protein
MEPVADVSHTSRTPLATIMLFDASKAIPRMLVEWF